MRTVRIEVTAEDIEKGVKDDCGQCPIALALRRAFSVDSTYADHDTMCIFNDAGRVVDRGATPVTAAAFIRDFDRGRSVSPFSFDLELP